MDQSHRVRGRRILGFAAVATLLLTVSYMLPDPVMEGIGGLFGVKDHEDGAFSNKAAALDQALDNDSDVAVVLGVSDISELAPHVGVRRALRAGPMTEEEVSRATRILSRAVRELETAVDEPARDAIWTRAHMRLLEACPRLDAKILKQELEGFQEQLARAKPRAGSSGTSGSPLDCAGCHSQTSPLPDERKFDAVGLYPFMGEHEAFGNGRNIPLLVESLELQALPRASDAALECMSCHVPHDAPGFRVDTPVRVQNQGLWVNILPTEPGVFHVQVKTKNHNSGHRAPAGYPKGAYVVTVEAMQGGALLPLRYGSRLPAHLQTEQRQAGMAFARHMVDARGTVTTDISQVVDLELDTRLPPGRFAEDHFVFDRNGEDPVQTVVTLWYLPDYATWEAATPVRRAEETEQVSRAKR